MPVLYRICAASRSSSTSHLTTPTYSPARAQLATFQSFTKECPVLDPSTGSSDKAEPKQYSLAKGKLVKGRLQLPHHRVPHTSGTGASHPRLRSSCPQIQSS